MESTSRSRTTAKASSRSKSLNDRGSLTKSAGRSTRNSSSARQLSGKSRSRSVQLPRNTCDANLYTTVFGPTADESILVGLKTFMTICSECSTMAVAVPSDGNRRESSVTYVDPESMSSKAASSIPSLSPQASEPKSDQFSNLLEDDLEEEEEMVNQSLTEESIGEDSTTNNRSASLPFPEELIITPPPSNSILPPQSKSRSIAQYEPSTHSSQNRSKISQHEEDIPEISNERNSPQDSFHPSRTPTKSSVKNTPTINYSMHSESKSKKDEKQNASSTSSKDASSETCSCCSCNAEPPKIKIKKCECCNIAAKSKMCNSCCNPMTNIKIDCVCSTESQTDDSCDCNRKTSTKCSSKVSICSKCCSRKVSCQSCNCQTCRKKQVKVCCDCSTSTTDCESECGSCANESGDGVGAEIRYAICKITKFCSYTTFEVMKSTRKKPKVMPNTLEGVFVLRNKDCPEDDKCCVRTVTIECR